MNLKKISSLFRKYNFRYFINSLKQLQGNPHYVSMGMAIGVFVSLTPTFPFHTPIAVALAYIFKGSKRAAAIGVWANNPFTLPFCYIASYELGQTLLGTESPFKAQSHSIHEIIKLGMDVFYAMMIGGAILGLAAGIASYFITHKAVSTFRSQEYQPKIKTF